MSGDGSNHIYEINTVGAADPQCATGKKSADGKACCSATCDACVPDTAWNQQDLGFCTVKWIPAERSCSKFAPPCFL